jgi:hypothetical protein
MAQKDIGIAAFSWTSADSKDPFFRLTPLFFVLIHAPFSLAEPEQRHEATYAGRLKIFPFEFNPSGSFKTMRSITGGNTDCKVHGGLSHGIDRYGF